MKFAEIDSLSTRKRERKDSPEEERSATKKPQQDDMTNPLLLSSDSGQSTGIREVANPLIAKQIIQTQ